MLLVHENVSLLKYNTFGMHARARYFCEVDTLELLKEALVFAAKASLTPFIIGGGSNIVLLRDLDTLVIHMKLKGIIFDGAQVKVMAGESWHPFVRKMIKAERYGLENLSYIPGSVGGAPIQNIGAYGTEISERLLSVTSIDKKSGAEIVLSKADCQFGYRDSIFKQSLRDQYVITSITLKLDNKFVPNLDYADLKQEFANKRHVSALEVSDALIKIRSDKLPDPKQEGNVGSFFKNPVVSNVLLAQLNEKINISNPRETRKGFLKIPAALLISEAGLKGTRVGDAMVSRKHALVLTNLGSASPEDVSALIEIVRKEVKAKFDIALEIEPKIMS